MFFVFFVLGFGAYFYINYTPMNFADSFAYCKIIGMDLAKLDSPGMHNSAGQFLLSQ